MKTINKFLFLLRYMWNIEERIKSLERENAISRSLIGKRILELEKSRQNFERNIHIMYDVFHEKLERLLQQEENHELD